jgi:hypothetical protein
VARKLADVVVWNTDVMLQYVLVPAAGGEDAGAPCQHPGPCLVASHVPDPFAARAVPNLSQ